MREIIGIKIALALCPISIGLLLPSAARSDDTITFMQDVKTFLDKCGGEPQEMRDPFCPKEQAELHRRQRALNLRNEDVNGALKEQTKGGLHNGGPWYWYP